MSKVGVCRITSVFIIILFTLSVLGYSQYYLTTLETTKYPSKEITIAMLYVLPGLLVLLYSLLLSNYILCIIIKPQNIDEQYSLTTTEIAQFMIQPNSQGSFQVLSTLTREYVKARPDLQVRERDYRHGGLRICEMCSIIKPDRSHHCGICKRCVMRMDHHCHWVNNCIHEGNHKYFIQCITLGVIISLVTIIHYSINMGCSSCKIIPELSNKDYTVCLLLYMATGLSTLIALLVTFLTLDHCTNMFRGQTSYERVYERDHYNRGWKKNFGEIMGQGACEWLCPVAPTKLSPEQEPLIITVIEPSSAAWLETTNNRAYTQYEIEDEEETSSHHSRQSTSSQERSTERSRDVSLDEFADETLSLQQGQLGQRDSSMVTRVRTPSTIENAK